jgi:hypothetical protein
VINGTKRPQELGQLIINHPSGKLHFARETVPETKDLGMTPAFELLDLPELAQVGTLGSWYGFKDKGTKIATALSNRGCRAACTFCNVRTFNGVGVRGKTIDSVLEELRVLKYEHGIGHVIWLDDDLLYDENRAIELFNGMVQKNLRLTWDATNRVIASSCKYDVIAAAGDSGCIGMYFGIESGNNDILRSIKKPGTVETFLKAAEVLQKFEQINTKGFLMLGFPGESLSMICSNFCRTSAAFKNVSTVPGFLILRRISLFPDSIPKYIPIHPLSPAAAITSYLQELAMTRFVASHVSLRFF